MLRCTGRAYTPTAVRARPRRPGRAHLALPGTGVSRFVLLRGRGPVAPVGRRVQRRLHLDLRRGRRQDPGLPDPADPIERPLDAAGVDGPGAVPGGLRQRRLGLGGAVRAARLAGCPADLGDRARRGLAGHRRRRRGDPRGRPAAVGRLPRPAGQLLPLPAAGRGRALDGRARPAGLAAIVRAGGAAGRPRDPVAQRRPPRPGRPRPGGRLGPLARVAVARARGSRRSRSGPRWPASGCSRW